MLNRDLFVSNELPKTLSQEKINNLIIEYRNGNLKARDKIVDHNIRLVIKLVTKKFNGYVYDQQELIAIGILGLINAIEFFDINKNIAFSTYASKAIIMQILKELKKDKKRIKTISVEENISNNEGKEELKLKDLLYDKKNNMVENYEKKELLKFVYDYIQKLDDKKRKIFELYYFEGKTQQNIADMYNISDAYVSLIINTELKNLKRILIAKKYIEVNNTATKKMIKTN